MKYVYTAWLEDESVSAADPDREWPACFVVDGHSEESARRWGDYLAGKYVRTHSLAFVRSVIEAVETSTLPGIGGLPVISENQDASDDDIGW